jgi:hypothetical protein
VMNEISKKQCPYIHSNYSKAKLTKAHFIEFTARYDESSKYVVAFVWCEPHCSDRSTAQNLTDETKGVKCHSKESISIYTE